MPTYQHRFIVDAQDNRRAIILEIAESERLIDALEELEAIHAYDGAKASRDEAIPF